MEDLIHYYPSPFKKATICLVFLLFLILPLKAVGAADFNPYTKATRLVRLFNQPQIYATLANKKHPILNPRVFNSYGYRWEDVKIITKKELDRIPLVRLAKAPTNPAIYYLDNQKGRKKAHLSPAVFLSYGNQFKEVVTLSQADLDSYKEIELIKTKDKPEVYWIKGGFKKWIPSFQDFLNLGFKKEDIAIVSKEDLDSYILVDALPFQEPTIKTVSVPLALEVSGIKDKDIEFIPSGSAFNTLAKIQFKVSPVGSVTITGLTITRFGLGEDSDLTGIILLDERGKQYGPLTPLSQRLAIFNLSNDPIIVPANGSFTLDIKAHLVRPAKSLSLEILSASDIRSNAQISGNFPLKGPDFQITDGTNFLGKISLDSVPLFDRLIEVDMGAKDQILTKFSLEEMSGNEDVFLKRLILKNKGTALGQDITNIDLVDENNRVLSTTPLGPERSIIFDLEKVPFLIPKLTKKELIVRADITAGPGKTIKLVVEEPDDVWLMGAKYGFNLLPVAQGIIDRIFPIGETNNLEYNLVTIKAGHILTSKSLDSPSGHLEAGFKNAVLGVFDIRGTGSEVKLVRLDLSVLKKEDGRDLIGFLRLRNKKTQEIFYSTEAASLTNIPLPAVTVLPQTIKPGEILTIEVVADISSQAKNTDTYQVVLSNFYFQNEATGSFTIQPAAISSNVIGIKELTLTVSPNKSFTDQRLPASARDQKIGSFVLQAGFAENLIIKNITLVEAPSSAAILFARGYTNLRLMIHSWQKIGEQEEKPMSQPHSFNFLNLFIAKGESVTLDVFVDTVNNVEGDALSLTVADIIAMGETSKAKAQIIGKGALAQRITFALSTLVISKNPTLSNFNQIAGERNIKIGSFLLKNNGAEKINIQNITIAEAPQSAPISSVNGWTNLKLVNNQNGSTISNTIGSPVVGGNLMHQWWLGWISIEGGQSLVIDVYGDSDQTTRGQQIITLMKDIRAEGEKSRIAPFVAGDPAVGQTVVMVARE